jgi:protein-S-isoprenylcysteine O-methyltransferase Ste14
MSFFDRLWIYYVVGYIIAYSIQIWANKKRGEPFDDPDFLLADKKLVPIALLWIASGLACSIFVPVSYGVAYFIGLVVTIVGMIIGILALVSFAQGAGLRTSMIHRYSRNPVYVGWLFFMGGLAIMGLDLSFLGFLFVIYFLLTIPYFHWTIKLEESFLTKKYGEPYQEYLKSTPRYFGFKKK